MFEDPTFLIPVALGIVIAGIGVHFVRGEMRKARDPAAIFKDGYDSFKADDGETYLIHVHSVGKAGKDLHRALSVGAILSENNGFPTNTVKTGRTPEQMQDWLGKSWSVTDGHSARQQVESLLEAGHSAILDVVIEQGRALSPTGLEDHITRRFRGALPENDDLKEFTDNYAGCLPVLIEFGYVGDADGLGAGTKGYDLGRAVTVTRVAVSAGYLTAAEARGYCMKALEIAQERFGSWREFANSYMIGRALWGGVDDPDFMAMHTLTQMLLENQDSPWNRVGWA